MAGLAAHLNRAADVVVVTIADGWLAREAAARGVRVATVSSVGGNGDARVLLKLRAILVRERPDIVHSHLGRSDWYAWLATTGMNVRLVSTEHGISAARPELYGGRVKLLLHRLAHSARLRRTDVVIAVSRYTADALAERYAILRRRPAQVVLPGVDLRRWRDRHEDVMPDGALRVVCLSRLSQEKGIDILVRAVGAATAAGAEVRATIAGEGPERRGLESLVESSVWKIAWPSSAACRMSCRFCERPTLW